MLKYGCRAFCDVQIVHTCTCEGYGVYIHTCILYIRNGKSNQTYCKKIPILGGNGNTFLHENCLVGKEKEFRSPQSTEHFSRIVILLNPFVFHLTLPLNCMEWKMSSGHWMYHIYSRKPHQATAMPSRSQSASLLYYSHFYLIRGRLFGSPVYGAPLSWNRLHRLPADIFGC